MLKNFVNINLDRINFNFNLIFIETINNILARKSLLYTRFILLKQADLLLLKRARKRLYFIIRFFYETLNHNINRNRKRVKFSFI